MRGKHILNSDSSLSSFMNSEDKKDSGSSIPVRNESISSSKSHHFTTEEE